MTKAEKVEFVINTLQRIYPEIPIPLDHKDPYTLLIAVLLSAQCTDVRVNKMPKLDKLFKNILRNRLFPNLAKNHKFAVDTFKFHDLFFVYYNA